MKNTKRLRVMKPIHVGRSNKSGIRKLFTRTSRRICEGGKNVLGELLEDWCENERGKMVWGWYWVMLDDNFGKTFPRMRDAVADFERERAERRKRNDERQRKA
jgi:hypothetical protein